MRMMRPLCFEKDSTTPMGRRAAEGSKLSLVALLLPLACSSGLQPGARDLADANDTGRSVDAKSHDERALLARLSTLPSGKPERVGTATIVAEPAYTAASGRTCRALQLTQGPGSVSRPRLACSKGDAWFFVPDVFESDTTQE